MNNETRNSIVWLILFLAFFVFVARADSQVNRQVERLYLDWYMSGGYLVEVQKAEAEKEFRQKMSERERLQKMTDAVNLTAEIEQKLFFFHQRVVELNQGIYGKLKGEIEQPLIIPVAELNEKNNRLWELEKQERGKELERLAKELHTLSDKVKNLTK